jgi:hypothetical protein
MDRTEDEEEVGNVDSGAKTDDSIVNTMRLVMLNKG